MTTHKAMVTDCMKIAAVRAYAAVAGKCRPTAMQAALEAALAQAETQPVAWQPIETAPKDEEILVWNGWRRHVASFDKIEGAWVSSFRTTTKRLHVLPAPTHWQPLPDGPATEGSTDE